MNKNLIKRILAKYKTPKHVVNHMKKVAEVCELIADKLIENGEKIDKNALMTSAHIHDAMRVVDFVIFDPSIFRDEYTKEDLKCWEKLRKKHRGKAHEELLEEELARTEPKVARIVGKHGFFSIDNLITPEEKILYYADKRVEEDSVVSLKIRFKKGRIRNFNKKIHDMKKVEEVEKKVFLFEKELKKIIPDLETLLRKKSV